MPANQNASTTLNQPGVLPVFQTKAETKAFYNKISHVYDLLSDHSEAPIRKAALQLLAVTNGERILEIGFGAGHTAIEASRSYTAGLSQILSQISDAKRLGVTLPITNSARGDIE